MVGNLVGKSIAFFVVGALGLPKLGYEYRIKRS